MTAPDSSSSASPLAALSAALSSLAAAAAPSLASVRSHRALGSGFVWRPGLIVTADEALAEEGRVEVTLAGGERRSATVAGRDPTTDVALLRADTGDAPPLALDGPAPAVGALALALGAGEGRPIAAFGAVAVSGPAWRAMRGGEIDARIEIDAAMRRQAEGGPALGADGRAFGMAVFGPRRRLLVIPGATVARVAAQLDARGRVARGYLGLGLQRVRLDRGGGAGGAGGNGSNGSIGAMVMNVDPAGPGARAGVQQGDVIAAWDGRPIVSPEAMLRGLGPASVGTTVSLSLRRGGEERTVSLVIGERP